MYILKYVREILNVNSLVRLHLNVMKMAVFWVVAPYSLVEVYRRFRGACCIHHEGDDRLLSTSETSFNFSQTPRRNNPEDK
jgi:hypothetical protein